jgi:dienelactone hydrolase
MHRIALSGVVVLILAGCGVAPVVDQAKVRPTWEAASVGVPDRYAGDGCAGRVGISCIERFAPQGKLPVVVYMHGCNGPNSAVVDRFMNLGYVVVAPNSLARDGRRVDCAVGSDKKPIMRLRFEEAAYAASQLNALPWVDGSRLVLAGFSEGGVTAALYPGEEYAARIILGWTCRSGDSWWNGIRGRSKAPVLAVVGTADHYYQNNSNTGSCSITRGGPSRSVALKGAGHDVVSLPETWEAAERFLKDVLR